MYVRIYAYTNVRTNLRLYECTYGSTLIRMYVGIYAYTNVRTNLRLYERTYESMLIRMYVRIYAYTNVRTNLRSYECTYESTLIRMYVRIYAYMNVRICPKFASRGLFGPGPGPAVFFRTRTRTRTRSLHPEACIPKFASLSLHPEACIPKFASRFYCVCFLRGSADRLVFVLGGVQTDFVPQTLRLRAQALWGQTRHIMITDGVVMA
jgi:hypothetical protein